MVVGARVVGVDDVGGAARAGGGRYGRGEVLGHGGRRWPDRGQAGGRGRREEGLWEGCQVTVGTKGVNITNCYYYHYHHYNYL